jgi:predicted RNA-binding Zn ribbon-like protein
MTDPSSTWHRFGGRPALDLVNTLRRRWAGGVETLNAPGDLSRWLVAADLAEAEMPVTRAVLRDARALREAIDAAVVAVVAGDPLPAEAVTVIDDWLVHAGSRPQLALDERGVPRLGERAPADSPRRALGTIALDAARMLGDEAQRARVRVCAGEGCSVRFFDRSPAGRRRWCSMTRCGNVAKARAHRRRAAGGGGGGEPA